MVASTCKYMRVHSAKRGCFARHAQHANDQEYSIRVVCMHRVYHHCQSGREAVHGPMGQCRRRRWRRRRPLRWQWQVCSPPVPAYTVVILVA